MTSDVFFWCVFPWFAAVVVFGWIAYECYTSKRDHLPRRMI